LHAKNFTRTESALQKYVFHKNKRTQKQYCTASQHAPVCLSEVG